MIRRHSPKDSVKKDEKKMQTLSDKMSLPMMMVTGISSDSSMTADMEAKMAAQLPQDLLTEDEDLFDPCKCCLQSREKNL